MNKEEYMNQLKAALSSYEKDLSNEIIEDYEEHYQIGLEKGKTEEQVSEELGSIDELLKELGSSQRIDDKKTMIEEPIISDHHIDCSKQQSEEQGPTRMVLRTRFSLVEVHPSNNNQVNLNWENYGNERQKQMFQFHSWVEGNTIYGEVIRENGLFSSFNGPDTRISVQLPIDFPEIEIHSMSGGTVIDRVKVAAMSVMSASGDIDVRNTTSGQCRIETKSGEVSVANLCGQRLNADTASGSLSVTNSNVESMVCRTLSGDNILQNINGKDIEASSASSDLYADGIKGENLKLSTLSGDCRAQNCSGDTLNLSSKSGNAEGNVSFNNCNINFIGGDVDICNNKECKVTARSVSGDVKVKLVNITGYEANIHTVSGSGDLYYNGIGNHMKNGTFTMGTGASKINVQSVSGDIVIQA